jgi:protein-disulfide isomerase
MSGLGTVFCAVKSAATIALVVAAAVSCEGAAPMAESAGARTGAGSGSDPDAGAGAGAAPGSASAAAPEIFKVPVGTSPVRGSPTALVTIVEFADYQCPFCLRAELVLRELSAQYGDKVRVVFKNEPLGFHEGAEPAAEAALAVRDEKGDAGFWAMHDLLLQNQRGLGVDEVVRMAASLGAREDLVRAAIDKHAHQKEIDADQDLADDLQADGTPHFFVNGRRVAGAMPKDAFVPIVEEEITRARGLLQAGTPPAQLYDALIKDGKGAPDPERVAVTGLPADDPARGPARAAVTIHEFGDFQCPYCAVSEATLSQIVAAYGDSVRIVWHDLPLSFHDRALPAARAAREARREGGDGAFWKFHDAALSHPRKLSQEDLEGYAKAAGLDVKRWKQGMDADANEVAVFADRTAAAAVGIQGTPTFVIAAAGSPQGYVLEGAQGFAKLRRLVARALAEAGRP